jgi:hypothetical protein
MLVRRGTQKKTLSLEAYSHFILFVVEPCSSGSRSSTDDSETDDDFSVSFPPAAPGMGSNTVMDSSAETNANANGNINNANLLRGRTFAKKDVQPFPEKERDSTVGVGVRRRASPSAPVSGATPVAQSGDLNPKVSIVQGTHPSPSHPPPHTHTHKHTRRTSFTRSRSPAAVLRRATPSLHKLSSNSKSHHHHTPTSLKSLRWNVLPAELRFRFRVPLLPLVFFDFGRGESGDEARSFVWGFSIDYRKLCEAGLLFGSVLYAARWIGESKTPKIPYIVHPRTNELLAQGECYFIPFRKELC